jgi:hypothetical protein
MKALIISLESFQRGEIPEEVQKYILSQHGKIFTILDESSKIKTNEPCKESKKSKRTQAVMRLNRIGERCILTGTFMSKSPVNAYDQMSFLKDGFFPEGMYAFAEHYVIRRALPSVRGARITITQKDYEAIYKRLSKCKDDPNVLCGAMDSVHSFYGISREDCAHILKHKEYTPFKNIDELWNRIGDNCVHPKKEDILDVPPKIYENYKLELTKEQRDLYLQLQNQHCTDRITVDNGLKLYLRFQDICNGYEPVELDSLDKNGNPIIYDRKPLTITGLALALGFNSRQTLLNYQGKAEFMDTITRAKAFVERYAEERLYDKDGANGAKFSLSNNFEGWREKQQIEADVKNDLTINIELVEEE